MAVLPDYRPTLPALARRRFGLPAWVTVLVVLAVAALAGLAVVLAQPGRETGEQLIHRGDPQFNLVYDGPLRSVEPRPGELVRLEARRGRISVAVVVRPLTLPAYEGDVAHGLLPAFASGYVAELAAGRPQFQLREQLRARVNDAPGYEIAFREGPPRLRTFGRDLLLVPTELETGTQSASRSGTSGAVILSFRQTVRGRRGLTPAEHGFTYPAKKALRSFAYGTERP